MKVSWRIRLRPRNFTLSYYIGRRFASIFAANALIFCLIYALVDSLNQIDAFLKRSDDFSSLVGVVFTYYYYEIPGLFCRIMGPVLTMASAMFTATLTARANEFVPILATGTSLQRALAPTVALAVVIAAGSMYVQEIWIPEHRDEIRQAKSFGRDYGEMPHAYYIDSQNGVSVAAMTYYPSERRARGLWVRIRRSGSQEEVHYTATEATWNDATGGWTLRDGKIQRYDADGQLIPEPADGSDPVANARLAHTFETFELVGTNVIPQDLEGSESQDQYMGLGEIARKAEVSPESHRWWITYYARCVDPLNHFVLLLLGVPTLFFRGTRNVFLSALVAVLVATGYFIAQAVFIYLGNRQVLGPATAAWLAPMLFGALGLTLYRAMRT